MALEELIQSANDGDVNAMNQLGDHYVEDKDYSEALSWFSKSAEAGNLYGTARAMSAARVVALLYEDVDSEEVRRNLSIALDHCLALLSSNDESDTGLRVQFAALKAYPAIIFGLASSFYDDGNIEAAKRMLQDEDDTTLKVLLGLCYMKTRSSDANEMRCAFEAAYSLLHIVETEEVPDLPVRYQYIALMALSTLYRIAGEIGIQGVPVDINRAYQCVLKASNLSELPEAVCTHTNAELGKYHKKFFGGYYYEG